MCVNMEYIQLFYVSQSHHLNSSYSSAEILSWLNDSILTEYTTSIDTRSLSVTSNSQWSNTTQLPANITAKLKLLFYEESNGTVSALLETGKNCVLPPEKTDCSAYDLDGPGYGSMKRWIDISNLMPNSTSPYPSGVSLHESYTNATFSTPFSSAEGSDANFTVSTLFNSGSATPLLGVEGQLFLSDTYANGSFGTSEHRRLPNSSVMNVH